MATSASSTVQSSILSLFSSLTEKKQSFPTFNQTCEAVETHSNRSWVVKIIGTSKRGVRINRKGSGESECPGMLGTAEGEKGVVTGGVASAASPRPQPLWQAHSPLPSLGCEGPRLCFVHPCMQPLNFPTRAPLIFSSRKRKGIEDSPAKIGFKKAQDRRMLR